MNSIEKTDKGAKILIIEHYIKCLQKKRDTGKCHLNEFSLTIRDLMDEGVISKEEICACQGDIIPMRDFITVIAHLNITTIKTPNGEKLMSEEDVIDLGRKVEMAYLCHIESLGGDMRGALSRSVRTNNIGNVVKAIKGNYYPMGLMQILIDLPSYKDGIDKPKSIEAWKELSKYHTDLI